MASKAVVQKFALVDKRTLKIPVNHTRTGACSSKNGKCTHGMRATK